ncbi:hypothetical protein B0T21DRAFT_363745 [Apiosordaria backusii]|uniref:RRM domain-containing protein n=1 Tax=Apiosordaria backusii TaxID=314023 RepID=A0AA40BTE7_9PEZI|nr:hypothetical protein B0T21DRAFT_363745 [Apiosordaria backusii]
MDACFPYRLSPKAKFPTPPKIHLFAAPENITGPNLDHPRQLLSLPLSPLTTPTMSTESSSPPSSPEVKNEKSSSKKRKTDLTEIEVDINLPEPPSKKAKRLLKKGKSLPAKPKSDDEGDSDSDSPKAADGETKPKKEKKERSPYGVWIGNLRFTVTKQELKQWFVDNSGGAITLEDITRVHLPTAKPSAAPGAGPKKPTENRGFAYVDFATYEANVAAISLSETEWYRRKVLIKDAKSFEGRPEKKEEPAPVDLTNGAAKPITAAPASTSTKVFVGNLSFQVTEDDLREHFHKCGPIRWVKVATFEDTGKCKGYGWVNFETADAAQWAVKGFVKVRETIDTVEDFMDVDEKPEEEDAEKKEGEQDDDEDKDNKEEEEEEKKPAKKQPKEEPRVKTRKWWVNQLLGRTLKIELAEDDQTRYQKRFRGKGGAQRREQNGAGGGEGATEVKEKKEWKPREDRKKDPKYHQDINVARLTGAAVAPTGKKTTFE